MRSSTSVRWSSSRPIRWKPATKIGLILLEKGEREQAATELSLVLAATPDDHRVRYYLGTVYAQSKAYDLAIEELQRIPAEDERFVDAQLQIAALYDEQGRPEAAIKTLREARKAKGDHKELISYQAMLYREQRDFDRAIRLLKRPRHRAPRQ